MTNTHVAGRSSVLSLPNLLTYGRIAAVPLVALCLVLVPGSSGRWIAVGLFVAASVSDYLDGYLARAWNQQSELGRMLDPIADKLLVGVVLLLLVHDGTVSGLNVFAALIILAREIAVSGLREFLAELRVKLHVTWFAKFKTAAQLAALGVLIIAPTVTPIGSVDVTVLGLGLLWIAAILTLYTGFDYLVAAVRYASAR